MSRKPAFFTGAAPVGLIRRQLAIRRLDVAALDKDIAEYAALPPDRVLVNMKTFATPKAGALVRRLRAKRDRLAAEADRLQAVLDAHPEAN